MIQLQNSCDACHIPEALSGRRADDSYIPNSCTPRSTVCKPRIVQRRPFRSRQHILPKSNVRIRDILKPLAPEPICFSPSGHTSVSSLPHAAVRHYQGVRHLLFLLHLALVRYASNHHLLRVSTPSLLALVALNVLELLQQDVCWTTSALPDSLNSLS